MPDQALSHIKVLDLTHYIAGPYCTKLLADYGADVIKIECPAQGDSARRMGPFLHDQPHREKSGQFLHLNGNKRGITLNLKNARGKKIFQELLKWADVVAESFQPGVMNKLGLSYEKLARIKPELVMISISNFGQYGPYRDWGATEIVEFAMGGPMLFTGIRGREPAKLAGNVGMYFAGCLGAIATLASLFRCGMDDLGDHIDLSIMETQAGNIDRQTSVLLNYQYTGQRWSRGSTDLSYLSGIYPCQDGYIEIRARERIPRLAGMLGRQELSKDPRFSDASLRDESENLKSLDEMLREFLARNPKAEVWKRAQESRVLSAPMNNAADVISDPHFRGRGTWPLMEGRETGILEYAGRPFIMEKSPWQVRRPAPGLGEHNYEVYCQMLGYSRRDLIQLRHQGVV